MREDYDEVYNLPDNVFQKPKKQKSPSEVPKVDRIESFCEKQQVVDDDFLRDAFSDDKPALKKPEETSSPLKSPSKSPTKSPLKAPARIDESGKEESKSLENPFLRNMAAKESSFQVSQEANTEDPEKSSKEVFEVMNDEEHSMQDYDEKEPADSSEDHEVYEPEEEIGKGEVDSGEDNENYVQDSAGLRDILEASNENSENLEVCNSPEKLNVEDEVKQNEEEKRDDLREKLEEAVKREKELNNLIDIKVRECEKVLGKKNYEEIIGFFREKLNVSMRFLLKLGTGT